MAQRLALVGRASGKHFLYLVTKKIRHGGATSSWYYLSISHRRRSTWSALAGKRAHAFGMEPTIFTGHALGCTCHLNSRSALIALDAQSGQRYQGIELALLSSADDRNPGLHSLW